MTTPNEDELERARPDATGEDADDTEGHGLLLDHATATSIQRARSQDIERQARERLRAKEARPNRDNR